MNFGDEIAKSLSDFTFSLINGEEVKVTKIHRVDTPDGLMHFGEESLVAFSNRGKIDGLHHDHGNFSEDV